MRRLPRFLRRIRVCQVIASLTRSPYQRITIPQGELVGNVRDNAVAHALVRGEFVDYGYYSLAAKLLQPGDTHVDIGANYGFHTFGLVTLPFSPSIHFFLLDANPDCAACLRQSIALHPRLRFTLQHAAAGAAPGEITFSFTKADTGSGHVGSPEAVNNFTVSVPMFTLDSLLRDGGVSEVGLMKMDIEGSELSALRGLSTMLAAHRVKYIYFEVNPYALEIQRTDPLALLDELARHGYRIYWPHDDTEWIRKTYGDSHLPASALRKSVIRNRLPHTVIEFDRSLYRKGGFGQCDLLAIAPGCPVSLLEREPA